MRLYCLACLSTLLLACTSHNYTEISETTTNTVGITREINGTITDGFQVKTSGNDTIVTLYGRQIQMLIKNETGHSGRIELKSLDLKVGRSKLKISGKQLKYAPPGYTSWGTIMSIEAYNNTSFVIDGETIKPTEE